MGDVDHATDLAKVERPTIWQRLGFGFCAAKRPDEPEEGWAPSCLVVGVFIHLDWRDRLRLLVSGNLQVDHAVQTDVPVSRSRGTAAFSILPPGAVQLQPKKPC